MGSVPAVRAAACAGEGLTPDGVLSLPFEPSPAPKQGLTPPGLFRPCGAADLRGRYRESRLGPRRRPARPAVAVVGGARALARDHARAEGPLRRAGGAEDPALPRLDRADAGPGRSWQAFGSLDPRARELEARPRRPSRRRSARRRSALAGIQPSPRHSKVSRSSIVSSIAASARGLPSARTTRVYWFSTSQRPSARWRRIIAVDWRMSIGSKAETTTCLPYSPAMNP